MARIVLVKEMAGGGRRYEVRLATVAALVRLSAKLPVEGGRHRVELMTRTGEAVTVFLEGTKAAKATARKKGMGVRQGRG
ncbi:MAG: hypothetical protein A3E78_13755 [Alphaproteobacteria bacterium RIFCSPHIGHO2_12_FULL_63_12]|nr:MAG: hypothetical protein A3E78_13755 [Alphaproteobacteria bacterium RIFCSPHIGHO2_12_FULL_63_12]